MTSVFDNKDCLIIAEIGQAHEGSLGILHSYIDAVAETGVNAIKFQTHIAQAESSPKEPFRVKFSYEDKTRFDYWRRMEFTTEQWAEIKAHCDDRNLTFISSPFSNAAVDLLESIDCPIYKIGSGETSNLLLLEKIARTGKPIIISSGMSSFAELKETFSFLATYNSPLAILQCTTAYPTQPQQWGLNVIGEMKKQFTIPVGFSDHSGDIFACLAAATLGATIFEFHVTFHKGLFGPDTPASITIEQCKKLADGIRDIRASLESPIDKTDNSKFSHLKSIFEKSLAINKSLGKGHTIQASDLEAKKPRGEGIDAKDFQRVIGKKLSNDKSQWDFINEEDLI